MHERTYVHTSKYVLRLSRANRGLHHGFRLEVSAAKGSNSDVGRISQDDRWILLLLRATNIPGFSKSRISTRPP